MSLPKNNWPGIFCLVRWYILRTAKNSATKIYIHGSVSSTYVSCRAYVRTRLISTWCIISMVAFACGFPGESGFVLIQYYCSINLLLYSWLSNSLPPSYVISTGHGYGTFHIVSTKFAIVIYFLSLYSIILNHLVTGSTIVTDYLKIRCSIPFTYFNMSLWYLQIICCTVFYRILILTVL